MWNELFPILSTNRGQVFIRPMGYTEERAKEFVEQNQILKYKIQFLLDNRFLFEKITGIQDAVHALEIDIDCDYIENGRFKKEKILTFEKLDKHPKCPLFQACFKKDDPEMWQMILQFKKDGMTERLWNDLRHKTVSFCGQTLYQRWVHYKNNLLQVKNLFGMQFPDNFFILHSLLCTTNEEFQTIINRRY